MPKKLIKLDVMYSGMMNVKKSLKINVGYTRMLDVKNSLKRDVVYTGMMDDQQCYVLMLYILEIWMSKNL